MNHNMQTDILRQVAQNPDLIARWELEQEHFDDFDQRLAFIGIRRLHNRSQAVTEDALLDLYQGLGFPVPECLLTLFSKEIEQEGGKVTTYNQQESTTSKQDGK